VFVAEALCTWRMHQTLNGFGSQLYNYTRAGGRLARPGDLISFFFLLRAFVVYAIVVAAAGLGFLLPSPWSLVLWSGSIGAATITLYRRKSHQFVLVRRYGFNFLIAVGSSLSFSVEALQVFLPSRFPALSDVVANTAGTFVSSFDFERTLRDDYHRCDHLRPFRDFETTWWHSQNIRAGRDGSASGTG